MAGLSVVWFKLEGAASVDCVDLADLRAGALVVHLRDAIKAKLIAIGQLQAKHGRVVDAAKPNETASVDHPNACLDHPRRGFTAICSVRMRAKSVFQCATLKCEKAGSLV